MRNENSKISEYASKYNAYKHEEANKLKKKNENNEIAIRELSQNTIQGLPAQYVKNWQEAINIAWEVSKDGTCPRRKVGAIFVRESDGLVLATGYNSAPPGLLTCLQDGCIIENHDGDERCIRTLHAEKYARLNLDKCGISPDGLTLVTTCRPCHVCARDLAAWKISRVVYSGNDPLGWSKDVLVTSGIELLRVDRED